MSNNNVINKGIRWRIKTDLDYSNSAVYKAVLYHSPSDSTHRELSVGENNNGKVMFTWTCEQTKNLLIGPVFLEIFDTNMTKMCFKDKYIVRPTNISA